MTSALLNELTRRVQCEVRPGEPLAGYTTYRIGGPAGAVVLPRHPEEVAEVLRFSLETGTSWLVLGLGSNVLVRDRGFNGIVLRIGKGLDGVVPSSSGDPVWTAGAGMPTPLLARRSARAGLEGVQRLVGVPGSVGGGVFMNAGAHGQDLSQVVREVEVVDANGSLRHVPAARIAWRYRGSGLDGSVVIAATLEFRPGDPVELSQEVSTYLKRRRAGTPFDQPCCGSVFRNPVAEAGAEARTAGQLIDAAGLKAYRVGGAEVSPMHANYIVNLGGATAADVLRVIEHVRGRVLHVFGVELELEVKIIGEG
jgi:UDP-N-acetylmuramate dehydrogenase